MIANFAGYARKKLEKKNHDQLVVFFCKNIEETSTWTLLLSITNNVEQLAFSNKDANELVETLCSQFGIRTSEIEYFRTFTSAPPPRPAPRASNVIPFALKNDCRTTNNKRLLYELHAALQAKNIEHRQALGLVIKIIENYPDTEKLLQG